MKLSEKFCKSILCKSGISDYCINCYTGCSHGCIYCYAQFIMKFTNHSECWGKFLDVKINAPDVLRKEIKRKKVGEVIISSVCDAYQPAEEKYRLTRKCIEILQSVDFPINILTKSKLVLRDFELFKGYPKLEIGFTITTIDENVRRIIEPNSSSSLERIKALEKAKNSGIRTYAFLGPLLPHLCDNENALRNLFRTVSSVGLDYIYVDRLNLKSVIWNSIYESLKNFYPGLINKYRDIFTSSEEYKKYSDRLKENIIIFSKQFKLENKLIYCF